jgi:Glucokinase
MLQALAPTRRPGPLFPRLLGDVGGTHARFAWQSHEGAAIEQVEVLPCAQYPSLADAVQAYLRLHSQLNSQGRPACAALGIATPVLGDWLAMTNHPWAFSARALRAELGLECLLVLNDFTALALALPELDEQAKRQIGGGSPVSGANIALLGPGTHRRVYSSRLRGRAGMSRWLRATPWSLPSSRCCKRATDMCRPSACSLGQGWSTFMVRWRRSGVWLSSP